MKITNLFILTITLTASLPVLSESRTADVTNGAAKAKSCVLCHNVANSMKGRGTDIILSQITAIRNGSKAHAPRLDKLEEPDLLDIAAYLNGD